MIHCSARVFFWRWRIGATPCARLPKDLPSWTSDACSEPS